jgi:hypothetical protein
MAQRLATVRAAWNEDRSQLVPDTHEDARVIAYPVGEPIKDGDVEAYDDFLMSLDVDPDAEHGTEGGEPLLAEWRVFMDGNGNLVHERDPLARSVRYAVGDVVDPDDIDEYKAMGEAPESYPGSGVVIVKEDAANKARTPAANKGAKPPRSQTRATAGTAENATETPGGTDSGKGEGQS